MKNKNLLMTFAILIISLSSLSQVPVTFTDSRDGKVYKTVTIGTQTWMAENLDYKTNDGCWAYNNDTINAAEYGYLYNWKASNEACPTGWRLSSDLDWKTLTSYLGDDDAADKLTYSAGFNALPGGSRDDEGDFSKIGDYGYWWTSTESSIDKAWYRTINEDFSDVYRADYLKEYAYSVRCIKDNNTNGTGSIR